MTDSRVIQWLLSRDTGVSSKAIVAQLSNIVLESPFSMDHPHDPADLGRCIRLLEAIPEFRERLDEMKQVSLIWAALVDHWDELETLYKEELPTGRAPKCYARMQQIIQTNGGNF